MRRAIEVGSGLVTAALLTLGFTGWQITDELRPWVFAVAVIFGAITLWAALGPRHEGGSGASTATKGPTSPASSVTGSSHVVTIQISGSGTVNITQNGGSKVNPVAANAAIQPQTVEERRADLVSLLAAMRMRADWPLADVLLRLAFLRKQGVEKRNSLTLIEGDDLRETTERANRIYNEWFEQAVEWIRRIPQHGRHEEQAFRIFDTLSMDAVPGDLKFANDGVKWIAALFSTHIQRLEEIRRRYSRD